MKKINLEFDTSEIKETDWYKQGIYKITNTTNNDFYIGSVRGTSTFRNRFCCHRKAYLDFVSGKRKGGCTILYRAFDKYKMENFKIEILEILKDPKYILEREEFYIKILKPKYNICQTPTTGGSPNKNRKLTKTWKEHIREKSKLYKHSPETLEKVKRNNKLNSCKIILQRDKEILSFNSWKEVKDYFHTNSSYMISAFHKGKTYKGYTIIKKNSQKKQIKVFYPNEEVIYESFNACDRALNMWRGYTSTMYTRKINLLKDKYKYEII